MKIQSTLVDLFNWNCKAKLLSFFAGSVIYTLMCKSVKLTFFNFNLTFGGSLSHLACVFSRISFSEVLHQKFHYLPFLRNLKTAEIVLSLNIILLTCYISITKLSLQTNRYDQSAGGKMLIMNFLITDRTGD